VAFAKFGVKTLASRRLYLCGEPSSQTADGLRLDVLSLECFDIQGETTKEGQKRKNQSRTKTMVSVDGPTQVENTKNIHPPHPWCPTGGGAALIGTPPPVLGGSPTPPPPRGGGGGDTTSPPPHQLDPPPPKKKFGVRVARARPTSCLQLQSSRERTGCSGGHTHFLRRCARLGSSLPLEAQHGLPVVSSNARCSSGGGVGSRRKRPPAWNMGGCAPIGPPLPLVAFWLNPA